MFDTNIIDPLGHRLACFAGGNAALNSDQRKSSPHHSW